MIPKQTIWNVAEHSWKQNKATVILWLTYCLLKNTTKTTSNMIKTFLFVLISAGSGTITDAEIKALSETLYVLDSNKASTSELVVEPQALVPDSETGSQSDLSPKLWGTFLSSMFVFLSISFLIRRLFLCPQLVPIPEREGSVRQTHLCCSAGAVGQLQQDDWTDRGLQPPAAGRTGHLSQRDNVQHWAGQRAVCVPLHQR